MHLVETLIHLDGWPSVANVAVFFLVIMESKDGYISSDDGISSLVEKTGFLPEGISGDNVASSFHSVENLVTVTPASEKSECNSSRYME